MTRTALVLQHQRNAPPALLSDWARQRGVELTVVRADRAPTLPEPGAFALAITLGSDHSAGHRKPAWVDRELEWLRLADRAALPVLGICFGAQALAVAPGGSVEHARQPEIGWISVRPLRPEIVEDGPWFAWHEDVFVLPPAATEIARNGFGPQAFLAGPHLGVQFHPEVAEMWSVQPSGVRWLALTGLHLGRLLNEGRHHADRAGANGLRLFDAFAAHAASYSKLTTRRRPHVSLTEANPSTNSAGAAASAVRAASGRAALELALARGELREVEILWNDHQGHPRGKRITADGFLERAQGQGFAFCDAVLCWDVTGDVKDGLRWSSWDTGFPDLFAIPDLDTYRTVPWRTGVGQVICDLYGHDRQLVRTAPRTVLRRVLDRLAALGYEAEVGVEIEFHLLTVDRTPFSDGVQAYSLQKALELDPALDAIVTGLTGYVDLEGSETEYGPGQVEVNLRHTRALNAAGQAARLKYGARELARQAGGLATFMAKPFDDQAGNSMHLHVSLWRDGAPVFAPEGHSENALHRRAVAGLFEHLPGVVLYGAPTVNSYKRFTPLSFAPSTRTWGHDNRTVAIRSLVGSSSATRIELRTGGADAEPHWAIAAALAAIIAGLEGEPADPGEPGHGNLYGTGEPLPSNLADGIAAARADAVITEILGEDAVHDYTKLAEYEWETFLSAVTDWDRDRYLTSI